MQTTNIVAQQLPNAATHTQQKYACALRSRSSKEAHAHIFLQWLMCCSRCLQSKWLQLSCAECWALDQIWIVLVKTRLCGFFPQEPGVRFLLQLLSSTFFFSHITKISATSDNVKNYVHPKPTSHALLRSVLAQAVEPEILQGVYGPRRAAEGPCAVHPWECGPCCVANGPYPRWPRPFLQERGLLRGTCS